MKENFLAPEQYQYNSTILSNLENISEDDLPPFNEKIDIYKIPAITGQFQDLWLGWIPRNFKNFIFKPKSSFFSEIHKNDN